MTLRRCHPGYCAKSWAWPCSCPMGVFWKKSQEPFGAWSICFWSQTVKWWLLKLMFIGKCDKFYCVSLLAVTCLNVHVLVQWPWELLWESLSTYQAAPKLSTSISLCIRSVTYLYICPHTHVCTCTSIYPCIYLSSVSLIAHPPSLFFPSFHSNTFLLVSAAHCVQAQCHKCAERLLFVTINI